MKRTRTTTTKPIAKTPTGIRGLDDITGGGLPAGRPTLVCGNAGCGKTLMAMEFLARGAIEYGEPGVFMAFEETGAELTANIASLGFDLNDLVARKKLVIDHVHLERSEIEQTGEYDLEGLFVRLKYAIEAVGAKRVVLDTIETLFGGLPNPNVLRSELRRLFRWLKTVGVTAVITGERGDGTLTRQGIEEYVSDCVIVLDHRVVDQMSTRRLRIVKYRGSKHGTNEYPFLIDERGFNVMPLTSLGLDYAASRDRVSTGIPRLDTMLTGQGFYRGSSVLVSGTAGTGKTSVAAHFAQATCGRGERCLYFLFEESPDQMVRNMTSIGLHLDRHVRAGLLKFAAARPSGSGLEMHLATMHKALDEFKPRVVIIDPISAFTSGGSGGDVKAMLVRLVDLMKSRTITSLFVDLTTPGGALEHSNTDISSLIDTWLLLRDIELNGERNRTLYVLKSRGMSHSNQLREFVLTGHGVELKDVYIGAEGVLTGSSRISQEAREAADKAGAQQEVERHQAALQTRRAKLEAEIASLKAEYAAAERDATLLIDQARKRSERLLADREVIAHSRYADSAPKAGANGQGAHP